MSFFHASGSSKHILKVKPTSKFMLFLIVTRNKAIVFDQLVNRTC